MNTEKLEFASHMHRMAYLKYNEIGRHNALTAHLVNKLISYCSDDRTGILKKLYNHTERRKREIVFRKYWNENVKLDDDDPIRGDEINVLLFLVEMLCLEDTQKKRHYKLNNRRRGHVV